MALYKEDWQIPGHWFDYFSFFEIKEDATEQEIKNAYRKKAKQYHSDTNPNDKIAEENFKKASIAYEILSNPTKREAYYNDYKLKKQKTNQNNYSKQNTSNTQNNQAESDTSTQSQNDKEESIDFDDIVENYSKNRNNKEAKSIFLSALTNIVKSFKEYAKLVNETYLELFNNLNKNQMEKNVYDKTKNELKEIILDQIKEINAFQIKYSIINEFEIAEDLTSIIREYKRKIMVLSINYILAKMFIKEILSSCLDQNLIISKFFSRIQDVDKKYTELESKMDQETIDNSIKSEFTSLLKEYQQILEEIKEIADICNKKAHNNSEMDILMSLDQKVTEKMDDIKTILNNFDLILELNTLLKQAEIYYQKLMEYSNKSLIVKKVITGELTREKFHELKKYFNEREYLTGRVAELSIKLGQYPILIKNKVSNIKRVHIAINNELFNNIIMKSSWQDLVRYAQIKTQEEQKQKLFDEAEETAKKLNEELQPVIDFIISWNNKSSSYKSLMASSWNKAENLLELCEYIETRMYEIPLFKEKRHNLNSYVMKLNTNCRDMESILKRYKEFIKKMMKFENYIDLCSKNIDRLEELLKRLNQEIDRLLENENQKENDYIEISKKIKEILKNTWNASSTVDKFSLDNNTIQEEYILESEMRSFYNSRNSTFTWPFPKLDKITYHRFKKIQAEAEKLLKDYSLKNIKKIKINHKFEVMKQKSKEIMSQINQLLNDRHQGKRIDWQLIIANREALEEMLEEATQLIVNDGPKEKSDLNFKFYQELKMNIEHIPTSEKKYIEYLKLRALKLLKAYNENKKQIKSTTITKEMIEKYIQSYYDYQMEIVIIKSLTEPKENERITLLESQINIYQIIMKEIETLKSRCQNIEKLENKYKEEMRQKKKELYILQNSNQNIDMNNLWRLKELEEEMKEMPDNKTKILEYLEIIGRIAKEEYLKEHPESEEEINNVLRNIEAEKKALNAKKNALFEYMKKNNLHITLMEDITSKIEEELENCESELSILYL